MKRNSIVLLLIMATNCLSARSNISFVYCSANINIIKMSNMTTEMNADTLLKHSFLKSEKWKMNHLISAIMSSLQMDKKEKGIYPVYLFYADSMCMYYGELDKEFLQNKLKMDIDECIEKLTVYNHTSLSTISEWIWQRTEKGYMVAMEMKNKRKYVYISLKNN